MGWVSDQPLALDILMGLCDLSQVKIIGPSREIDPSSSTKDAVNNNSGLHTITRGPCTQARNIQMAWSQRLILANTLVFEPEAYGLIQTYWA